MVLELEVMSMVNFTLVVSMVTVMDRVISKMLIMVLVVMVLMVMVFPVMAFPVMVMVNRALHTIQIISSTTD